MEFLKRQWRQIQGQMLSMSANTRWVFGLAVICLVLVLLLTLQYAGASDDVSINSLIAPDRQTEALQALRAEGLDVRTTDGGVRVPQAQWTRAAAVLQRRNLMAADTAVAFDTLLADGQPWESSAQLRNRMLRGKMQILGMMIREIAGVHTATVVIDVPEKVGFGVTHQRPSASVTVVTEGGRQLDRHMVDSIAGTVSGAVAQMQRQDVQVIDANTGRSYTARKPGEFDAEASMDLLRQREDYYREKFLDVLKNIPNVIVAVNVQIDNISARSQRQVTYQEANALESERTDAMNRTTGVAAAEPGTRANVPMDPVGAAGETTTETRDVAERTYFEPFVTGEVSEQFVPQMTRKVNATVRIPKSYLVAISGAAAGADAAAEEGELDQAFIDSELERTREVIEPLIETSEQTGVVRVTFYDDGPMTAAVARLPGADGMARFLSPDMIQPAGLLLLALTAVGIMLSMARKANQRPTMPTAAELAGVPPTLPGDEELLGEVVESEAAMPGVEVDEADLRSRKIASQISELIRSNPAEASNLFNKWVQTEE